MSDQPRENMTVEIDPTLSPADAAIAEAAIGLVAVGDFSGAIALLRSQREARATVTLLSFRTWCDLPARSRPPFWEWLTGTRRDAPPPPAGGLFNDEPAVVFQAPAPPDFLRQKGELR